MNDRNGLRPCLFFFVFVRVSLVFRSGISDWHGEGVAIFIFSFGFSFILTIDLANTGMHIFAVLN